MGALYGTLSYKMFFVSDAPDYKLDAEFVERVAKRGFAPLEPEGEDEEHYGWVAIDNPLRTDDLTIHDLVYDRFVNLAIRQDRWAVPGNLLKLHLTQAERAYMDEHGKAKISKFEKEDLKAMVHKRLRERSLPRMKVTDMSWDVDNKIVRFWSQSSKAIELFQGLFEDTFGLQAIPANPYTLAARMPLSEAELGRLQAAEPTDIATEAPL